MFYLEKLSESCNFNVLTVWYHRNDTLRLSSMHCYLMVIQLVRILSDKLLVFRLWLRGIIFTILYRIFWEI
jgi:hypothetical protein